MFHCFQSFSVALIVWRLYACARPIVPGPRLVVVLRYLVSKDEEGEGVYPVSCSSGLPESRFIIPALNEAFTSRFDGEVIAVAVVATNVEVAKHARVASCWIAFTHGSHFHHISVQRCKIDSR